MEQVLLEIFTIELAVCGIVGDWENVNVIVVLFNAARETGSFLFGVRRVDNGVTSDSPGPGFDCALGRVIGLRLFENAVNDISDNIFNVFVSESAGKALSDKTIDQFGHQRPEFGRIQ